MLVQPVLGACRIGINAVAWLDDDTVRVAHGSFISWCDAELKEQRRLTLQSHVQAIAPYADGGVAASLEGAGVLVVSPEGQVAHEYPMERARGVFTKPEACSADGEVAVLRSVQDEGKDYHYTVAELYSRTCSAGQRYGSPDSFGSDISSLPDVSPCLGVAIGAGMWGIAVRPLVGPARELKCAPFEWPCLLEAPWCLLSRGMHIEKVNLETGEVAQRLELGPADSGNLRLERCGRHVVARIDRHRVVVVSHELEVLAEHDFGRQLVAAVPNPSLQRWVLVYSPDDVSPRQLATAKADGKPRKHKRAHVPALCVAADDAALYLGGVKSLTRLSAEGLRAVDVGAGAARHLERMGSHVLAFGTKLIVADAGSLKPSHTVGLRATERANLWVGLERGIATSGGSRVQFREGEPSEHKLRSPSKHVLAVEVDGGVVHVDGLGWLTRPGAETVRLLELDEEQSYVAAASRDGLTWAIAGEHEIQVWSELGAKPLRTIPNPPDSRVIRLVFAPDASSLVIGRPGSVQLVELTGERTRTSAVPGQCEDMAFTPSGKSLFVALGTHLGGPFGDLVEGEVRAFDTHDLSLRFRLLLAKDAALFIGPTGDTEALGNAKSAAQLAVTVTEQSVAPVKPAATCGLLVGALG